MHVLTSFSKPILLASGPESAHLPDEFESKKKEFKDAAQSQSLLRFTNSGFIEVRNRSLRVIECSGITIEPGVSALFAAAFSQVEHTCVSDNIRKTIGLKSTLVLERGYNMMLASEDIDVKEGLDTRITLEKYDQAIVEEMLAQFKRYITNCSDEDLLKTRKEHNPEFNKYCHDPKKYEASLSSDRVLIAKT